MAFGPLRQIDNEAGYILVVAVMMLAVVTVIGVAATRTSETEIQISANERDITEEFYEAEGAMIDSLESYQTWLTTTFLTSDETAASYSGSFDFNNDSINDALVEARPITDQTASNSLSSSANDLPSQSHTGPPPSGSGYSMKNFEVRRYGVTASSTNGNSIIQSGVWKVFNKFD